MPPITFMPLLPIAARPGFQADPEFRWLSRALRRTAATGLVLVLAWPAARGHNAWLGWLPLWLAGMPAIALWALHRCPLPRLRAPGPGLAAARGGRRGRPQARRLRPPVRAAMRMDHAA
jgi:hypothetical protein